MRTNLDSLLQQLQSLEKPLLLVAIDGHSATGKSTLAMQIQQALATVTIVHTDDFYRVMEQEERIGLDAEGGYRYYYDWQRLERQVLQPLAQGSTSRYQQYDWLHNQLGDWVEGLQPVGIVLVEGCYAMRPALRHYYDVKIYVEASIQQREQRQHERGDSWAWVSRWHAAEDYYMKHCRPQDYADFIVVGE